MSAALGHASAAVPRHQSARRRGTSAKRARGSGSAGPVPCRAVPGPGKPLRHGFRVGLSGVVRTRERATDPRLAHGAWHVDDLLLGLARGEGLCRARAAACGLESTRTSICELREARAAKKRGALKNNSKTSYKGAFSRPAVEDLVEAGSEASDSAAEGSAGCTRSAVSPAPALPALAL